MFNVGDRIKANMALAEKEYENYKQFPDVYDKFMEAARNTVFEVVTSDGNMLTLKRKPDDQIFTIPASEAAEMFAKAEEPPKTDTTIP